MITDAAKAIICEKFTDEREREAAMWGWHAGWAARRDATYAMSAALDATSTATLPKRQTEEQ